jgi:predicted permease
MTQSVPAAAPPRRLMLTLAISDFRNIWRDGLLAFLILLPLFIALIYRLLIPDHRTSSARQGR